MNEGEEPAGAGEMDSAVLLRGSRRFLGLAPDQVATLMRVVLVAVPALLLALVLVVWAVRGPGGRVAQGLMISAPAVAGPLAWLALRRHLPGPNGDDGQPGHLPAVFVSIALLGLASFLAVQRAGFDLPPAVQLAWLGIAGVLVLLAVPLATRRWEWISAGVAGTLLFVSYVLATTTTHAFYFGATDLMGFRPSLQALAAGSSLAEALPEATSGLYDAFPAYYLIGASAALLTGQDAMRATFQIYSVMYPAAALLMVGVLRRFGVQERVAWLVFLLALASRPLLGDATYPTPRSLVFLFTVVLLLLFVIAWRTPRTLGPAMFLLAALVDVTLAMMHKVSGVFALVPLVLTLVLAVPFMARPARVVRSFVTWTLSTLAVMYVAYAFYVSEGLRDALTRLSGTQVVETGTTAPVVPAVRWSVPRMIEYMSGSIDVILAIGLTSAALFMLLGDRGTRRWRIHPAGLALIALLSLQMAYYSPLYATSAFSDLRLHRLAQGAMLFVAIPMALLLVALFKEPTRRPARTAMAVALVGLFVFASYGVASINQDLALRREEFQETITFEGRELQALDFGRRFTGDIHCDVYACVYFSKDPFIQAVRTKVYDASMPLDRLTASREQIYYTLIAPGFFLERTPEIEAGYAKVVDKTGGSGVMRMADDVPEYAATLGRLQEDASVLYSGAGIRWYLL